MNIIVEGKLPKIAMFLDKRIQDLKGIRNQKEIAKIAGYQNPNIITMIKGGQAKVALDRVPAMAKALDVDVALLMGLALEQFYSRAFVNTMIEVFKAPYTADEVKVLEAIREAAGGGTLHLTEEKKEEIIRILKK